MREVHLKTQQLGQSPTAAAAARLPPQLLREVGTLFSPDTLLDWHRWLIARNHDGSDLRGKRGPVPRKANSICKLVLRMAADNPSWGYGRIHGELKALGYDVHWQTVRRITLDRVLLADPDKPDKSSWKTFFGSHWESFAACDSSRWMRGRRWACRERMGGPLNSCHREAA